MDGRNERGDEDFEDESISFDRSMQPVEDRVSRRSAARPVAALLRLQSGLRLTVEVAWTLIWITVALVLFLLTRRHDTPLALARRVWAPGTLRILGTRLEVEGLDQVDFERPHLFVANHASQLDIPVAFAALPVPLRFLAKEELRRIPLVGHYIAAMGMVFIDRHDSDSARESIDRLARLLGDGMSLLAFPEGTRSTTGEIRPFKTGPFVAAIKSGVSVVPVSISGTADVLPAGGTLVRPGRVRVRIGPPVPIGGMTLADRKSLADRLRDELILLTAP